MQKLASNLKFYFDEEQVLSKTSIDFINRGWTLNFDETANQMVFAKMRNLLMALIKTEDMD